MYKRGRTTEGVIRQFLVDRAWLRDGKELRDTDSLLERGVIDSMAMVELISFIEETYNIRIQDEDLMPEHFDSLASIAAYIQKSRIAPDDN